MDEDEVIAALVKMRDGYEKSQRLAQIKAWLKQRLGSDAAASWYLRQTMKAQSYRAHVGRFAALPFGKAMVEVGELQALADAAIKAGDVELGQMYIKALADAPEETPAVLLNRVQFGEQRHREWLADLYDNRKW